MAVFSNIIQQKRERSFFQQNSTFDHIYLLFKKEIKEDPFKRSKVDNLNLHQNTHLLLNRIEI